MAADLTAAAQQLRRGDRTAPYELTGEQAEALADLLDAIANSDMSTVDAIASSLWRAWEAAEALAAAIVGQAIADAIVGGTDA